MTRRSLVATLVAGMSVLPVAVAAAAAPAAKVRVTDTDVQFQALVEHAGAVLVVETPAGAILRLESAGVIPSFTLFDAEGQVRADGLYRWELRLAPPHDLESRDQRAVQSRDDGPIIAGEWPAALGPDLVQSGSFRIAGGSFVDDEEVERPEPPAGADKARVVAATQVINDNLQVNGWVLLRDFHLGIKFDDTGPQGFPANDWALTTNDSAGFSGLNKFSIEDTTGAKVPFTILAGAPSNSLFVGSQGWVGLGTSVPETDLHMKSRDGIVAVRFETATGFRSHVWDVYATNTSFQLMDVNSHTNPLHIAAGAPDASLWVAADGNVGVGTDAPAAKLHVRSHASQATDGKVLIEYANFGTPEPRELLELRNGNGQAVMIFKDVAEAERWAMGTFSTSLVVDNQASAGVDFTFGNSGNFTAAGTITPGSSRTIKEAFAAVEGREILSKVLALPITTWSYKADPAVRHIGPMAEDFFAAFAVGADAKGISVTDSAGVALTAIQALHQELSAKDAQIAALHDRLAAIEATIASLARR